MPPTRRFRPLKKRAAKPSPRKPSPRPPLSPALREGALLVFAALAVFLAVALATHHVDDRSWSDTGAGAVRNAAGQVGAHVAHLLFLAAGYLAYLAPVAFGWQGWTVYRQRRTPDAPDARPGWRAAAMRWGGFLLSLAAACALGAIYVLAPELPGGGGGGVLGRALAGAFVAAFSEVGATVLLLAMLFAGVSLWTGFSWLRAADATGRLFWDLGHWLYMAGQRLWETLAARRSRQQREQRRIRHRQRRRPEPAAPAAPRIEPRLPEPEPKRPARSSQIPLFGARGAKDLPPLDLLDAPVEAPLGYSEETLTNMSQQIELKLEEFGVEAKVVAVAPGPVITHFDLEPAAGVRGSSITKCAKDLARALSVNSVRVVEVVHGRSVIGLEVPNEDREMVRISEILRADAFAGALSLLTLALGKSIDGQPVVCDLARMPHLLVAGATGTGKSVAINAMILSLLYKALPADLRLILIDPKMLEFSIYRDIPHLLAPVVTDMQQVAPALLWCVAEMERRYRLMSKLGVRDLGGYNRKIGEAEKKGEPLLDPTFEPEEPAAEAEGADAAAAAAAPPLERLPWLVVVIDEFADLMMVVGKKVEDYVTRLAQKARAAGIHLILATQRPTREVITGLIKANFPARIALSVVSQVDSRTILDQSGAEHLLGRGDMLFLDPGAARLVRVHGAFVSTDEIGAVVKHLREHGGEPSYLDEITQGAADGVPGVAADEEAGDGEEDPLYRQAVEIVLRDRKSSVSYLQRRLKVGYNRAARLVEAMELAQIVGPAQPGGGREILVAGSDE